MKPGKPVTATSGHGGQAPVDDLLTDIRSVIERAACGAQIVATLSRQLVLEYERGFAEKDLRRMVRFATAFPNAEIVSALFRQLSWSHFGAVDAGRERTA